LPLQEADQLRKELTSVGAEVAVRGEAVKLYPLTPQTRSQVDEINRRK
jgi:hypothetical protein